MQVAKRTSGGLAVRMNIAAKLKLARQGVGLSTRKVVDKLPKRWKLSHATLANYEKGLTRPPLDVLAALAEVYERPINWFLETGMSLENIRYRNVRSRVRVTDKHRFESEVQRWLDAYVAIEQRLGAPLQGELASLRAKRSEEPAELAQRVRQALGFSATEPIASVAEILERFGVRAIEQPTDLRIDGMAAKFGDEFAVVINPCVPSDRCRLNAAHELGHVVFGDCDRKVLESKESERRAFEFASVLLLPNAKLKEAFTGQSMVRLVQFKQLYGISLAAMVYRAEKLGHITNAMAKRLWMEFSRRGWRTNEPGAVKPDRATRFEQVLDSALFEKRISLREAASVAAVRPEEIRRRIYSAMGIDNAVDLDEEEPPVLPLSQP